MYKPIKRTTPLDVQLDSVRKPGSSAGLALLGLSFVYYLLLDHDKGGDFLFGSYAILMVPTILGLFMDMSHCLESCVAFTIAGGFFWMYGSDAYELIGATLMTINLFMMVPRIYENIMVTYPELEPKKPCNTELHEFLNKPDEVLITEKATKDDLEKELNRLRDNFARFTHLRSYECRLAMINHMYEGYKVMEGEFIVAVMKDLGGDKDAAFTNQIMATHSSFNTIQRSLKQWMKREYRESHVQLAPANSYILYQPLGVIGIMGCWNFPVGIAIMPAIEAIAAGNCVMMKLSERALNTEKVLVKYFGTYCHPHFFSTIVGDHKVAIPFSQLKFDKIFFTGGWVVGKHIAKAAAENMIPCIIESGGKNPVIVDKTADIETAAQKICAMAFLNTGQLCIRPDAVHVHESHKDQLAERLRFHVGKMWGSDVTKQKTGNYGLMLNQRGAQRMEEVLKEDHGGKCIVGGENCQVDEKFIPPTIIVDPKKGSTAQTEEMFGPILQLYGYDSLDKVFEQAYEKRKDLEKPLAMYYFGDDESKAQVLENMTAGSMCVNDCCWQNFNRNLPFGGVGKSGRGSYYGKNGFITFSHPCGVMEKPKVDQNGIGAPPLKNWIWLFRFLSNYGYYLLISQWAVLKRMGLIVLFFVVFIWSMFFTKDD